MGKNETTKTKPAGKKGRVQPGKKETKLFRVSKLAKNRKLPAWELAALRQATGWAPGKQVSKKEFEDAVNKLRDRPQGGGRI